MFRKRAPDPLKTNTQHSVEVTVVGEQCFGATDQPSMACVKRLAALAATDLLSVRLSKGDRGPHFLSANPMPALKDPELAQAVCDYLSK
jgi:hypothetical protein